MQKGDGSKDGNSGYFPTPCSRKYFIRSSNRFLLRTSRALLPASAAHMHEAQAFP